MQSIRNTLILLAQRPDDWHSVWARYWDASNSMQCRHAYLWRNDASLLLTAGKPNQHTPLAGLPISVKDLFDVKDQVTRSGSQVTECGQPATRTAPAIQRLFDSGATQMGRTHMAEFAFSGIGTHPYHLQPAAWDGLYNQPPRGQADNVGRFIPGGSSSGAAISVASGSACAGIGTDTGGSIRIPAAFNGLVGYKPTTRLVPKDGCFPLSQTLDTACAITLTVDDAILIHEIMANRQVKLDARGLRDLRIGWVDHFFTDDLDHYTSTAITRSLNALSRAGAQIENIRLAPLAEISTLQEFGGITAIESYAIHRDWIREKAHLYDPRVLSRILRGEKAQAWQYLELLQRRQRWISAMQRAMLDYDILLSPTVATTSPQLALFAPHAKADDHFTKINALILRNTSIVNLLDGCAISVPCHHPDEMPVGLMVWSYAFNDDRMLASARHIEQVLRPRQ